MSQGNATFAPRQRVGTYELLVELGSGGTATVGIAVQRSATGFERLVVVKRMHRKLTKDREFAAMLLDEARLASSVRHLNVVPVIDVVQTDDEVALVMEYTESVSMSQLLRSAADGKKIHPAVVSRIVVDALTGLHEAHEAVDLRGQPLGIVHRDVSPENIIVGTDGVSRIIDFGIAMATIRLARTRAGVVKGKCSYMAPEQVDGQPVDRRCDVFAAGIVLWEALTGRRLFRGDDEFDEMRRVMNAPIPALSRVMPDVSSEVSGPLDAVLGAALARPPPERFQTAKAFARALEQAVAPAPAAVVAEHVTSICGSDLEARRSALAAILGEELARLTNLTPMIRGGGAVARTHSGGGTLKMELATPRRPAPVPRVRTLPSRGASVVPPTIDVGPRPVASRARVSPPRWRALAILLAVSVLAGAALAFVWLAL